MEMHGLLQTASLKEALLGSDKILHMGRNPKIYESYILTLLHEPRLLHFPQ